MHILQRYSALTAKVQQVWTQVNMQIVWTQVKMQIVWTQVKSHLIALHAYMAGDRLLYFSLQCKLYALKSNAITMIADNM